MADFKNIHVKIYKYILLPSKVGVLKNSDVLKRLYEIKDTGLQVSQQVDHIKVKLLRQH
jgi:hypothetical protein